MGHLAMKGSLMVLIGILAVALDSAVAAAGTTGERVVPAVFVLGDSTLDVGNNNHLSGKGVPRANVPFYGIDFPGGPKATGRFSNGYNVADFIAKNLGFERSPVAYLVLKSRNYLIPSALTRGVSYASAGAGILDSTVSALLANSFFLLSIGSNDLFQSKPKTPADVVALYTNLVSNYSAAITDLYGMGARKFGIINMGPVGCVPRVRVLNATGACNDGMNRMAVGFSSAVKSGLAALAPTLPGFAYSLADSFAATNDVFANPQSLGFVNADSACCGVGRLGAEDGLCKRNSTMCADRDTYMFWDAVHSTQRAAELAAQQMFDGPSQITEPISFKQLAQKKY